MENSSHGLIELISWTLIHFLWQGTGLGIVAYATLVLLRKRTAQTRYVAGLCLLVLLVMLPACTFCSLYLRESHASSTAVPLQATAPESIDPSPYGLPLEPQATAQLTPVQFDDAQSSMVHHILHLLIVCGWIGGQLLCAARLWWSVFWMYRVRRAAGAVDELIQITGKRLANEFGMRCPEILSSDRVQNALACGFFRETVIIPSHWLAEMTGDMIEAVLAHEFAHLRRHDLWVNLFQRTAESILFFHPVVWWLSGCIRRERELCCDAMAVDRARNKHTYAKTLEFAARASFSNQHLLATQMGDDRMSLLRRIEGVLGEPTYRSRSNWWPAGVVGMAVATAVLLLSPFTPTVAEEIAQTPNKSPQVSSLEIPQETLGVAIASGTYAIPDPVMDPQKAAARAPQSYGLAQWKLGEYIIEPPDILQIKIENPKLRTPRRITPSDTLRLTVENGRKKKASDFSVDDDGTIQPLPGEKLQVAGLTEAEATRRVSYVLDEKFPVKVRVVRATPPLAAEGRYLVNADGTIRLGVLGPVFVAGQNVEQVNAAVTQRLSKYYDNVKVSLDLWAINSKFFYIVVEGDNDGDQVIRVPASGNETVLDAISQIGGIGKVDSKSMVIRRPATDGSGTDDVLTIDWDAITRGADTSTNYQMLPGDRLFVRSSTAEAAVKEVAVGIDSSEGTVGHNEPVLKPAWQVMSQSNPYSAGVAGTQNAEGVVTASHTEEVAELPKESRIDQFRHRIPLLGTMTNGGIAKLLAPPADDELLEIIKVAKPDSPLVQARNRQQIVVQKSLVADYVDPPRLFPLVGPAQMHHAHYKVTLELANKKDVNEVFYVDHQHLHANDELQHRDDYPPTIEASGKDLDDKDVYVDTYYVADLVTPIAKPAFSNTGELRRVENAKPDFETLINLITSTVAPNSWEELGGPGVMEEFEGNRSLVISNTEAVHDQINGLIRQLRGLQEAQVELRSKTLSIPGDVLRKFGLEDKTASLISQTEWQQILQNVRRHPKARIYHEQKARIFNGQFFTFQVAKNRELKLQPVIASNNKSIRLTLFSPETDPVVATIGDDRDAGLLVKADSGKYKFISAHPHFHKPDPKNAILGTVNE